MKYIPFVFTLIVSSCTKAPQPEEPQPLVAPWRITSTGRPAVSDKLKARVDIVRVEGAALMLPQTGIESIDDGNVPCDIVRFELCNTGSQPISMFVLADRHDMPFSPYEALEDGDWTAEAPFRRSDGLVDYFPSIEWRYPARRLKLAPLEKLNFALHVERWRFSAAESIRVKLLVAAEAEDLMETVYSAPFSLSP